MEPERIEELKKPGVFPGESETVSIIQTHLSVVCLTSQFAYKFKKAIRLPFADFTTVAKRRHFCEEELHLNRRLCPGVYLEVVSLVRDPDGGIHLGEDGETIDYAVKMQRLPADRMMDVMLDRDAVTADQVRDIAAQICRFQKTAEQGKGGDDHGSPDRLREFALANFEETASACDTIFPTGLHKALRERTVRDFDHHLPLLRERAEKGKVIDGHGDLHARNICLTDPPSIYDCIEFEPAFRYADVATEHAFLLMDLLYRRHPDLASTYLEAVLAHSGDRELPILLPTLMRYRAMVRAKVAALTAAEPEVEAEARTRAAEDAAAYLRFAAGLAVEEDGPTWLIIGGLPGAGKSTVAQLLGQDPDRPVLSSDRIRKELAGCDAGETLPEEFYHSDFSDQVYAELAARAGELTASGAKTVILDANFRERSRRDTIRKKADRSGVRALLVFLELDPETAEARIRKRNRPSADNSSPGPTRENDASDADVAVYRRLLREFEPPALNEALPVLCVDASGTPGEVADNILTAQLESRI